MEIPSFKNMNLLAKKQQESYENAKSVIIVKKKFKINILKIKNIVKLEIIVIMQEKIVVLCIAYII